MEPADTVDKRPYVGSVEDELIGRHGRSVNAPTGRMRECSIPLDAVSSSNWTYLLLFAFAFGDVLFSADTEPDRGDHGGRARCATGELLLGLIIVSAAAGAILGDNTAYLIGRQLGDPVRELAVQGRETSASRPGRRPRRAIAGVRRIIIGRFIPGGRSAVCFAAGVLHYPWPRFIGFDVVAGVLVVGGPMRR